MKRIYIISLFVCFLFLIGCYNYIDAEKGGYLPKRKKFQYQDKPYQLKASDLLKDHVVYVSIDTFKYNNNPMDYSMHFYKFYKNGRYHKGFVDAYTRQAIKDYNRKSILGYYRLDKDTLRMEFFFVKEKEGGDFIEQLAIIKKDTLQFSSSYKGKFIKYVPRKIEGLDQNTHW